MQIGLLGKANVGKSTFFSAATNTSVQIGNFPFTTIKPNVGVTYVTTKCACKELKVKHDIPECKDGTRYIPVKIIDIAGLVPGAHEGKGLGNQFLDDSRQADILIHIIDAAGSTDIQGQPTTTPHDPKKDIAFVEEEFDEWFSDLLEREWSRLIKEVGQKKISLTEGITRRFSGLGAQDYIVQSALQDTNLAGRKPAEWSDVEKKSLVKSLRKKIKPIINVANKADLYQEKSIADTLDAIPCSAETELLLSKAANSNMIKYTLGESTFKVTSELSDAQSNALKAARDVLDKFGNTGVQRVMNQAVFDKLNHITIYPVEDETKFTNKDGVILPDAKLLPSSSTAKQLAFLIHQDIGKGFLHGINIKTKQRIGADYTLIDGDIIKIVSTKSRG